MKSRFIKDKDGNAVLIQTPNWIIIGWAVLTLINQLVHSPVLGWLAIVLLLVWALMEIFWGVNYFRRLLGVAVLILTFVVYLRNL